MKAQLLYSPDLKKFIITLNNGHILLFDDENEAKAELYLINKKN